MVKRSALWSKNFIIIWNTNADIKNNNSHKDINEMFALFFISLQLKLKNNLLNFMLF
jgi:hypothetical protein